MQSITESDQDNQSLQQQQMLYSRTFDHKTEIDRQYQAKMFRQVPMHHQS